MRLNKIEAVTHLSIRNNYVSIIAKLMKTTTLKKIFLKLLKPCVVLTWCSNHMFIPLLPCHHSSLRLK